MNGRQKNKGKRVEHKERTKRASFRPFASALNRRLIGFGVSSALIVGLCASPALLLADDNTLKPDWNNPQTPHNQQGQSGIINLGAGGTYSNGYNGTSLRYYYNDDGWVLDKQHSILAQSVAQATINSASAVAAEAVAIADLLPAPIALGGVAVAMAAFDLAIASENLELFNSYVMKTVNAVDYSGSLTVNGYGTLGGTYQNIETMTLTTTGGEGEVKLDDGALDTIQSLKSAQDFVITSSGEVYNVETAKFDKNFANEGTAVYVGAIKVEGSMQNEGKLAYIGPIEANSLVNTNGAEMLDVEAINVKSMSNLGDIIVDDLKFGDLENSGSLSVLCQTSGETMSITGDFASAGSVDVDVIDTEAGSSFLTKGALTAGAFTSKGTTIVQGPVEITRKLKIDGGSWTSVGDVSARNIDINGSFTALGSVETVDPLVVRDNGKAYFGGPLSAAQIKNTGEIYLEGPAVVDSLVDLGENGKIAGTSPNASLKAGDMVGGSVSGLHSLDVNGYVWDVDVDMGGAGSSANVGRFVGSTSVSNVGTLVVRDQSGTSGAISGAGVGSTFTFLDESTVGDISNFGSLSVAKSLTATSVDGAGVDATASIGGDLNVSGDVQNIDKLVVGGNATLDKLFGTGEGSVYKIGGDLGGFSSIDSVETLVVGGTTEVAADAEILGTGAGSRFKTETLGGPDGAMAGNVENFERLDVANDLTNKGEIIGTGAGSRFVAQGDVTNQGEISNYEYLEAGAIKNEEGAKLSGTEEGSILKADSITNSGEISGVETAKVAGAVENAASGTIAGTGAGSTFKADSVTNGGAVSGLENIAVAGAVENAAGATITGTGVGSTLAADSVTNSGDVAGVENIGVTGAVENAAGATITGTGAGSVLTADSVTNGGAVDGVERIGVAGALENAQDGTISGTGSGSVLTADSVTNSGAVAGVESIGVTGAVENAQGATITGTGAGSTIKADSVTNSGDVSGVEAVEVAGAIENAQGATFAGTGAGSTVKADSMTNSGDVSGVETVEVVGAVENAAGATIAGTGAGSTIKADSLTNNGDITNVEGFDVAGATENAAGATISGSGAGANAAVAGDMTNAGTYGGFDKTTVEGNLTNTGELAVGDKTSVGGDFTNDGGTLKTELYGNSIGSVAVEGSATVNGGTLAIDATGEKMQIGQYYYAIATDGGLTVESELTIDEDGSAPSLFHVEGFYDENNYYVGLRRDQEYGGDPQSANEASFGQYLDDVSYMLDADDPFYESSDVVKVLSALDEETKADPDAGRAMAQSMDGEIFADMGYATLMSSLRAHERVVDSLRPNLYIVCEQCGNMRHGEVCEHCGSEEPAILSVYPYPEEAAFGRRFWGVVFGSFDNVKTYEGARGFKTDSAGIAFGSVFYRNTATRIGVFGAFQNSAVKGKGSYVHERVEIDSYQIGAYGYRENTFGAFLGSATVGIDKYKTGRVWNWGGDSLARTHRAKTNGAEFALRMEEYANVRLSESVWQPYVATSFAYVDVNGLREKTTSGANEDGTYVTQLHNRDYNLTSWRSELGLRGSYCWTGFHGKPVALRGRASWVHEFCDTDASVVNSFTGTRDGFQQTEYQPSNPNGLNDLRYSVSSVDMGRDYAWLGIGLSGDGIYDVLSLFGGYDCLFNARSASHNIHIGVDCEW